VNAPPGTLLDADPLKDIFHPQTIQAVVANDCYYEWHALDGVLSAVE